MQSWPIQLHRLRINAGGPSKFRKGRFQFSWFLIVPQAFRCWEFERTRQKNDPHAAPHCVRCSATRTVLVAFTRNLTQINAILPGEQCIHILRIIALGRVFRGAHGQFSTSSLAEADPTPQGFGTKLLTRVFGSKRKLLDCGLQRSRSIIVTIPRVSTLNKRRRRSHSEACGV